ncbi:MAG: hypothetical protein ACD_83C00209G0001 [uncultured bacterium]|nr:MAG: hypothetical protein ACD_83C00209G0001 [uncultured bacterium]
MKIKKGFTLVELLVVISVIAVLAGVGIAYMGRAKQEAKYVRTKKELETIADALQSYLNDHEQYPADVNRGLPNGIDQYLPEGNWPNGPWTYSVYDWDNWVINGTPTHQVSLRFCGANDGEVVCAAKIPAIFRTFDKYSAVYYCLDGSCQSHSSMPANHPGFCTNCNWDESNYLWQ